MTVNVANDITAGRRGVDAASNGLVTVNQTAGTIQSIGDGINAGSVGTGGVVVNMTEGGDVMAARWLFAVFTALSAAGVVASYGATRGGR